MLVIDTIDINYRTSQKKKRPLDPARESDCVDTANANAKQYQECNTLVTRIEVRVTRGYKGT